MSLKHEIISKQHKNVSGPGSTFLVTIALIVTSRDNCMQQNDWHNIVYHTNTGEKKVICYNADRKQRRFGQMVCGSDMIQ